MRTTKLSHAQVRGAILGLALFFGVASPTAATELGELVQRWFADQSYILIENPSRPPRLILLGDGATQVEPSKHGRLMQQALLDLAHRDASVREDALLSLADIGPDNIADLIASSLADPSADVRDTAASILEDLATD